jgi:uncharacterized protein
MINPIETLDGCVIPMGDNAAKCWDGEKSAELAKPIYEIINRLQQPPTAEEYRKMKDLIRQGADLEVRYNDGNRETVLEIALAREYFAAALFLIHEGADIHARCVQDITPFVFAGIKGNAEVLQAMFDTGKVSHPDDYFYDFGDEGKTSLMCAAMFNHCEAAALLIQNGADMNHKNSAGKSALDYALAGGHQDVITTMQQATAVSDGEKASKGIRDGAPAPVTLMKKLRLKLANENKGPG